MGLRFQRSALLGAGLSTLLVLAAVPPRAHGQPPVGWQGEPCPCPPAPGPAGLPPYSPGGYPSALPLPPQVPSAATPQAQPPTAPTQPQPQPSQPTQPQPTQPQPTQPQPTQPQPPAVQPPTTAQQPTPSQTAAQPTPEQTQAQEPSLGQEQAAATGGTSVALAAPGGYLDNAIPRSMFRVRYDAAFDINRPDRAEFFYATWRELSFHPHGINHGGIFFDPKARGPEQLPAELDAQEVSSYLELAYNNRLSAFAEVPVRFLHFRRLQEDQPESELKRNPADLPAPGSRFFPEPGEVENAGISPDNTPGGLGDIRLGFKFALLADPDRYLTFMFRTYLPTGDPGTGLSTGHPSLEPGLLYYRRLDQLSFQAQFSDWIPLGGGPGAGNVLTYGLGLGYDVYQCGSFRVTPITEFVGWTVLSGFESFFGTISSPTPPGFELPLTHGVADASGDTIVNAKVGVRTYFGNGNDLYVGYGHALTGDRWYKDIIRVEYRRSF